ncbi:MAG: ATPase [Planctomycetes bacterium RBG_16_64_10]|nr:MAG: ATPase [Planctomycetes bacterium RBG_16_64_10]
MAERDTDRATIEAVLRGFSDPETGHNVLEAGQVHDLTLAGNDLKITLGLTTHSAPLWLDTQRQLEQTLRGRCPHLQSVTVDVELHARPPQRLGELGLECKSVIAVGSGKGGVGKSTIAACLAYALKNVGCHVGLLDSDVYGPSLPHLLGVDQRPVITDQRLQPILVDGMKMMSIGLLVAPGDAVIWRGPMLHGALTQFLRNTDWGQLDYLIIDMPPGTGDVALTLAQLLPMTGAVVVCTPQDVALLDAVKAIAMFRKVNIAVLGVVENMSFFDCPNCGTRHDLFGSGGARARAEELQVPFLGEVPINMRIRIRGDEGKTGANLDDASSARYLNAIGHALAKQVLAARGRSTPLPSL